MPVTSTSVTVATATASWTMPERHVRVAASRTVFRRMESRPRASLSEHRGQPCPKRRGAAARGMADVRPADARWATLPIAIPAGLESSARNGAPASISPASVAGSSSRCPGASARHSRGGRRLSIPSSASTAGRWSRSPPPAGAGELALRGQRDAGDARPAIAGRLARRGGAALPVSRSDRRRGGLAGAGSRRTG